MIFIYYYVAYLILATIGATFGLHRYWSHGIGRRNKWYECLTLFCALIIGVYKPLGWIGTHRLHHKYTDTPNDPHSPKYQGAWNVLLSRWDKPIPLSIVRDVIKNPRIRFMEKYGKFLIWPVIIFSPYTILLGYAGIGILNYFGHQDGKPMNRWFINILAPFEGNHNDHHKHN